MVHLPKVRPLVGLGTRVNTQVEFQSPAAPPQEIKGMRGHLVGWVGWGHRRGGFPGRAVGTLSHALCRLPCPCPVGLTLSSLHVGKQAQTSALTNQGFPAPEWLLQGLLDFMSSVASSPPRQMGSQSGPHYPEWVQLSSPALPGPPAGLPAEHLGAPEGVDPGSPGGADLNWPHLP